MASYVIASIRGEKETKERTREKRMPIDLCVYNTNERTLYIGLCKGNNKGMNQYKGFDGYNIFTESTMLVGIIYADIPPQTQGGK